MSLRGYGAFTHLHHEAEESEPERDDDDRAASQGLTSLPRGLVDAGLFTVGARELFLSIACGRVVLAVAQHKLANQTHDVAEAVCGGARHRRESFGLSLIKLQTHT